MISKFCVTREAFVEVRADILDDMFRDYRAISKHDLIVLWVGDDGADVTRTIVAVDVIANMTRQQFGKAFDMQTKDFEVGTIIIKFCE